MAYIYTKIKKEIEVSELITIHYFEYMNNFIFHGESHDFWEFLYVDKGHVLVKADDTSYYLHAGDIVFHKPNEFHAIRALDGLSPNLVVVSFKSPSPAISFFDNKTFTLNTAEKKYISKIIAEASSSLSIPLNIPSVEQLQLSDDADFAGLQLIGTYLELLLITITRNHREDNYVKTLGEFTQPMIDLPPKSELLHNIQNYMVEHIQEQLNVAILCDVFKISRSTLHKLFYDEYKCGAMTYYNRQKIKVAKRMMLEDKMNHTELAHYLSYSSLQYFSKQFKKATGMSPNQYVLSIKGISQAVELAGLRPTEE